MSINPADKPFGRIAHPDIYDVGTNILLADGSEGMTEIVLSDGKLYQSVKNDNII